MNENSDNQITEFNCLGCGAPFVIKHGLPAGLMRRQRVTCDYCGSAYLLPGPREILHSKKYGDYAYIGMANGDVYVSSDNGETWGLRHTFGSREVTSI